MADVSGDVAPVVLGFFAHPDDETLSAGGFLALLAPHAQVHVITATRGEMGEIVAPAGERTRPDRAALARTRSAEVAAACAHLGVASHRFLDGGDGRFVDSGMAWEDERRIRAVADPNASPRAFSRIDLADPAAALAEEIVRLRPTLVLTEEPGGGYGHPDHVRCHDVTMRALEIAAPHWQVPLVAFVVQEETQARAAAAELARLEVVPGRDAYGEALHRPDPAAPLRSGVSRRVDAVVDTTPAIPALVAAMRAHATQVHAVSQFPGRDLAGWFALTNNDLKPIPTHAALQLAPGRGTRAALLDFLADLGIPAVGAPSFLGGRLYEAFGSFFALFAGVVVGFAGSFSHRSNPPWGLSIALVAVLAGAVMIRTIGGVRAAFIYAAGLIASVLVITTVRTGGDVIIAQDALGLGWLVGTFVCTFIGALVGGRAAPGGGGR